MALLAHQSAGQPAASVRLLALAFVAALLPACGTDNPACIFGPGTCFGSGTGIGANQAFFPEVGQIIRDEAPTVDTFVPNGVNISPTSPIVITFTESIAASTVSPAAFQVTDTLNGFPVQVVTQTLADGLVLVLLPTSTDPNMPALVLGQTYQVTYNDAGMPITDVTGQELELNNTTLGTFTVAGQAPAAPSVLTTYPPANITNAPVNSELVVVFDAPVNPMTVGVQNLNALVDGMAVTTLQAMFQPLSVTTPFGGGVTTDTRVYSFRRFDADGNPALLVAPGAAGEVEFQISNDASPIEDFNDPPANVEATTVSFTLSDLFPPLSAMIVSLPNNAIGINNLLDPMGGEGDLAIDVALVQGLMDDNVNAFVFGRSIVDPTTVISVLRTRTLAMDFNTTTFGAFDLALSNSESALDPIFQDGDIGLAFRQQRGTEVSPLFVLDVEPGEPGLQDPVFDTTRPEIVGLGTSGASTTEFRSRFRDLTLVGRASEQLRAVSVTVDVGGTDFTNGMLPPVVGSSSNSLTSGPMADPEFLFIAAPVDLPAGGVLDPADGPRPMTVRLLDRALNESTATLSATFEQVGSTAPGAALAGPTFTVEVFDADTLQPVPNAIVATHQDVGGVVTPITMPIGPVTDANGIAEVPAAAMGETIVTVDGMIGTDTYDLFTLHGVTTDRISIPLRRTESLAFTQGQLSVSTNESGFTSLNRIGGDTRAIPEGDLVFPVDICFTAGVMAVCTGTTVLQPRELGAGSIVGTTFPSSVATYSAQSFLRAFAFDAPAAPVGAGETGTISIELEFLLDNPLVDDEELGINWTPEPVFDPTTASGIDLMMLDGSPEVAIQANVPGLVGSATVGAGVAFEDGMGGFDLRAAYAGAVDPIQDVMGDELGSLIVSGTIEPVLRLRTEIAEIGTLIMLPGNGNTSVITTERAGTRPRLDQMEANLSPLGVPVVQSPTLVSTTPADGYDIVIDGVINTDVSVTGRRGIYVVNLIGTSGRRWTIYRPDQNNAPGGTVTVRVPSLTVFGGSPLADAPTAIQVSAYAWENFDLSNFNWTDIQREYELFGHSAISLFN